MFTWTPVVKNVDYYEHTKDLGDGSVRVELLLLGNWQTAFMRAQAQLVGPPPPPARRTAATTCERASVGTERHPATTTSASRKSHPEHGHVSRPDRPREPVARHDGLRRGCQTYKNKQTKNKNKKTKKTSPNQPNYWYSPLAYMEG